MHEIIRKWQRLQNSPYRHWLSTGLALAIALLGALPLADEYRALRAERASLNDALVKHRDDLARLPALQEALLKKEGQVDQLTRRSVSAEQIHLFRGRIVELSREVGCQVRHIQLGERRQREWRQGDDPLVAVDRPSHEAKSPYTLGVQSLNLSVSGSLANVKGFLNLLGKEGRLMHTRRLSLQPVPEKSEVILELELVLFDLTHEKPKTA